MAGLQLLSSNLSSGQGSVWNVWECICMEWTPCAIFHLSLTKLLQLFSQLRRDTHLMCSRTVKAHMGWGAGMPWPLVYIIHLWTLHSYHKFTAEGEEWWSWIWYDGTFTHAVDLYSLLKVVPGQCCTTELLLQWYPTVQFITLCIVFNRKTKTYTLQISNWNTLLQTKLLFSSSDWTVFQILNKCKL